MIKRIKIMTTEEMDKAFTVEIMKRIGQGYLSPLPALCPLVSDMAGVQHVEPLLPISFERQYNVSELIRVTNPLSDDFYILLLTSLDIYWSNLNYVFGFTDMLRGISVVSISRLRQGAYDDKLIERAMKTITHEIGHLNGLRHCNNKKCVMTLSFSLSDTDRKDNKFCDRCFKRLLKIISGGPDEAWHTC